MQSHKIEYASHFNYALAMATKYVSKAITSYGSLYRAI